MLNIISRSILFPNVSGPKKVVENLIKGLEQLHYPYLINRRLDACDRLYIQDDRVALYKIAGLPPHIKTIVGPNLYVTPREIPSNLDLTRVIYLQPSEWTRDFWEEFKFTKCTLDVWATGVDANEHRPSDNKKEFVLIYFKQRFENELGNVEDALKRKGVDYRVIRYGAYKQVDYKDLLSCARYVIWVGRQESQGLALQEAMATNVPILVWDVSSLGHCVGGGEFTENEKAFTGATSAPYFSDDCGMKIKNLAELDTAIDFMEKNFAGFEPRRFVIENLSLTKKAKDFVELYEKYFGLVYKAGFQESILMEGDWLNNKFYYRVYLLLKHTLKIVLIKIGIWPFIR